MCYRHRWPEEAVLCCIYGIKSILMKRQTNLFALWPSSKRNEGVSVSELDNPGFSATADPELKLESPPVANPVTNPQLEGNAVVFAKVHAALTYE